MSSQYTPLGTYNDAHLRASRPDMSAMLDYYAKMYTDFWNQGNTAGMNAAHEAAEALRATMGYSGGSDGSQYISLGTPAAPPEYSPPPAPALPDYSAYYNNSGFSQMESQLQSLYDAQIGQTVDALNQQKSGVSQSSDELARQAYISYLRSREALPQQLAAMGMSGGLSETRQVELESGWQDRRNQIGLERLNALNAIDSAISSARANGQIALLGQLSGLRAQAQGQWNDSISRLEQNARDDSWKQYSLETDNYWKQTQLAYDKANAALQELARQQELAYRQQRDQVADSQWNQQFGYQQSKDAANAVNQAAQTAYQQQRDQVSDSQWNQQFTYQQSKDTTTAEWERLMFEYQKQQDALNNAIKQQQLLLQQVEAARKAALGK